MRNLAAYSFTQENFCLMMKTPEKRPAGDETLWKIWWLWGIPVGWTVSGLIIVAEIVRNAGYWGCGDLCDVVRLLIYFAWARLAWRCAHNVRDSRWALVSRFALSAGFVSMAMF
jgi:hypothetical protein